MALTADLVRAIISAPGTSSQWSDETVYGSPNPDRSDVAVYLTAYKVDEDQVETALEVEDFDPETADEFITENTIDGWYKYNFVIIPVWLVGTTYNQYDLVWDTVTAAFYEYINASSSAGNAVTDVNYFTPVADPTVKIANVGIATESGNLIYQVINKVVAFQTSLCFIKSTSKTCKESCSPTSDCTCGSRTAKLATRIRCLFTNLSLDEAQGKFLEGEKNARLAEKYCDECGCLTR